MKAPPLGYARATSLAQLWPLWEEAGPDAKLLAGGQSLLATLAFRLSEPPLLIDISRLAELAGAPEVTATGLRLPALTRHVTLERAPLVAQHAPLLAEAAPLIAHPAIRNRGTIGGSLAYADPAAELPACLIALDATVALRSKAGERQVRAADFFTGYFETALRPYELIAAVDIPRGGPTRRTAIVEVTRRSGDYAMAGLALSLDLADDRTVTNPRLVYFGVGAGPVVGAAAMAAIADRRLGADSIAAAQVALDMDLDPPADMHGPPAMKRHLARVLTARALNRFIVSEERAA